MVDARLNLAEHDLGRVGMRIAAETGGGLAEALERASQTLRAKLAMEGKIKALTSQGKLQAIVVGSLPLVLIFALLRMEPTDMGKLAQDRRHRCLKRTRSWLLSRMLRDVDDVERSELLARIEILIADAGSPTGVPGPGSHSPHDRPRALADQK